MIRVFVKKNINCPTKSSKIKSILSSFLAKSGIVSNSDVSVSIVCKKKMLEIAKIYLNDASLHNVLSFPASESKGNFKYPPDNILHLGEIILCYPKIVEEASEEGVLIDDKIKELVEHGALHLMGIHHE